MYSPKKIKELEIEKVSAYKSLVVCIYEELPFTSHIDHVPKKLKTLLGFYYRKKSCLNPGVLFLSSCFNLNYYVKKNKTKEFE